MATSKQSSTASWWPGGEAKETELRLLFSRWREDCVFVCELRVHGNERWKWKEPRRERAHSVGWPDPQSGSLCNYRLPKAPVLHT